MGMQNSEVRTCQGASWVRMTIVVLQLGTQHVPEIAIIIRRGRQRSSCHCSDVEMDHDAGKGAQRST